MSGKVELLILSADFEKNTLELQLPKDFWDKHQMVFGTTEITLGNGIFRKGEKIEPKNRSREFLRKQDPVNYPDFDCG